MSNEKENINYLPNLSMFFKIMGFRKPSSLMTKEFLGPCCPDKNTLKDINKGNRSTYKNTFLKIEQCMNQWLAKEGIEPIKIDMNNDRELGIEQQEWKGYLFSLYRTEWNQAFPTTFSIMHKYLMADIENNENKTPNSHVDFFDSFTLLLIFAAYEHDYQKQLELKGSTKGKSIILDILPKKENGKLLYPMKLLFNQWRKDYQFKNKLVCELEKEKQFQSDKPYEIEYYAVRTIGDWIAGATPPNHEQRISQKTADWITTICDSKENSKREWLRFVMACKLQSLLKNKPDSLPYIPKMYTRLFGEITTLT